MTNYVYRSLQFLGACLFISSCEREQIIPQNASLKRDEQHEQCVYSISRIELVNRKTWKSVELNRNLPNNIKNIIEALAIYNQKLAQNTLSENLTHKGADFTSPDFTSPDFKFNCFFYSKEKGENALAAYLDFDSNGNSLNKGVSDEKSKELSQWASKALEENMSALK